MKKTYRVVWEIDIDADTPLAAAKEAISIQRDKGSEATYFYVVYSPEGHVSAYSDRVLGQCNGRTQLYSVDTAEEDADAVVSLK